MDNLQKIIDLEEKLKELADQESEYTNEIENIVSKMSNLLTKLDNDQLIFLLRNGTIIHEVIDVDKYFKKYKINKKELKEDNSYKEEFKKLNNFIDRINDVAISEAEYLFICKKCDVDNVALFLLKNMSNEDIMAISNESSDWNYKLFLFGNLKK